MATTTVRIDRTLRDKLRELAARERLPMHVILDRAVEAYRRKCFLEAANRAYATLRNDPDAWQEEQAERHLWDATVADDVEERE